MATTAAAESTKVRMTTSEGAIEITLADERAPKTVANFLRYVEEGHYAGTIFHRTISNFMIQGGGFDADLNRKKPHSPVNNEADNGLKNQRGSIAMARTSDPHSAQAQFFINVVDNANLDFRAKTARGWGYAVFGQVSGGMDVVDRIRNLPTAGQGRFQNLPTRTIVIEKIEIIQSTGG